MPLQHLDIPGMLGGGQNTGELTPRQRYLDQYEQVGKDFLNFQSPFYQQFRNYLRTTTPNVGTNALLAPLVAGGGNYGASTLQAGQLRKASERNRNDFLNSSVGGFASQNAGLGAGILGNVLNAEQQQAQFYDQLKLQGETVRQNEPGVLDWLAPILGSVGGNLLMPGFGGVLGGMAGGALGGGGQASYGGGGGSQSMQATPFYRY